MTFGEANAAAGVGWLIKRHSWKDAEYVCNVPAQDVARKNLHGACRSACKADKDGLVHISAYFNKMSAGGNVMVGWVPSQDEMRATDWEITDYAMERGDKS